MKTIIACFVLLAAAGSTAAFLGCSSSDSSSNGATTDGGTNTTTDAAVALTSLTGSSTRGLAIVTKEGCAASTCHGSNLSGDVKQPKGNYSANITFDTSTGLGAMDGLPAWTVTDLANAFRNHVDNQAQPLCGPMPVFDATEIPDQGVADVYAYLKSIPTVVNAQPDTDCNGVASGDDAGSSSDASGD